MGLVSRFWGHCEPDSIEAAVLLRLVRYSIEALLMDLLLAYAILLRLCECYSVEAAVTGLRSSLEALRTLV